MQTASVQLAGASTRLTAGTLAVAAFVACGGADQAARLRSAFPAQAAAVLEGEGFARTARGFAARTRRPRTR